MKRLFMLEICSKIVICLYCFCGKVDYNRRLCFLISVGKSALFYGDFGMNLLNVDADEARQRSIKRCIASIFQKDLTLHRFTATIFLLGV